MSFYRFFFQIITWKPTNLCMQAVRCLEMEQMQFEMEQMELEMELGTLGGMGANYS